MRRPNEKGYEEGTVGFARRNFLVPIPAVDSWVALNAELLRRCEVDLGRRVRDETGTNTDWLVADRAAFRPLPAEAFEARRAEGATANSLSLVRFDTNDDSVPTAFAHGPITAVGGIDAVRLVCRAGRVADAVRSGLGEDRAGESHVHDSGTSGDGEGVAWGATAPSHFDGRVWQRIGAKRATLFGTGLAPRGGWR